MVTELNQPSSRRDPGAQRPALVTPRRPEWRRILWPAALLAALTAWYTVRWAAGSHHPQPLRLHGTAMGTTWSVVVADPASGAGRLRGALEETLARIESQMSVYRDDSEISRVNRADAGEPVEISPEFAEVLGFALELARLSGGAFDPTVGPLVELWGFGPRGGAARKPTEAEIEHVRRAVGFDKVRLLPDRRAVKAEAATRLDLNAVAKGYAVDRMAARLIEMGSRNFLVEVGGEIAVRGERPGGGPWRVGVDVPRPDLPPGHALHRVLYLRSAAVATSGDYRNLLREETTGEVWSHIFDPRDGRPARRMAGGVTVIADSCLKADGLATALYVMGPEEGLVWLKTHFPEVDALFVVREADGTLREHASPHFQRWLESATAPEP